jgi:AcrR family transcriptional regulator
MPKAKKIRHEAKANGQLGISKAEVLEAAVRVIDERGAARFSIREVARSLGVYPATLYWHVRGNKNDFLAEVAAYAREDFLLPAESDGDWRSVLKQIFVRYRDAMHKHPNMAPLIGAQLVTNGISSARLAEIILARLSEAGFAGEALIDNYNATLAAMVGFVTLELAAPPSDSDCWEKRFQDELSRIDADRFPLLHAALPAMANRAFIVRWESGSKVPLDGGFTAYVDTYLEGLARRAASLP